MWLNLVCSGLGLGPLLASIHLYFACLGPQGSSPWKDQSELQSQEKHSEAFRLQRQQSFHELQNALGRGQGLTSLRNG